MNVLELAGKYVELKKVASTKGGEYVGACPGCGGDPAKPSDRFHVWPQQKNGEGSWWCRGCGKAGDGIQFLIEFDGKTFPEACEALDKPLPDRESFHPQGNSWQRSHQAPVWQPAKVTPPAGVDVKLWREKAGAFVKWSHKKLMENNGQLQYLERRGIREETVLRFRLGYNPGEGKYHAFFRPRGSWGLPAEKKEDGREKKLWIPRGIVIPYIVDDVVMRIRIRRNTEDLTEKFTARYYVVPGSTMAPMLMGEDRKAFAVIETELDGMLVYQETGDLVGVLAVGSAAAKPDQAAARVLKESACILNALDFDQAGFGAGKWWQDQFQQAERWPVPVGKDPGEAFEQGVDLRTWVLTGLPPAFRIHADRTGPFSLDGDDKGAAASVRAGDDPATEVMGFGRGGRNDSAESGTPSQDPGSLVPEDAPEGLKELYGLMCRLKVEVRKSAGGMRLVEKKGYENWEESKRVSHLVFMDPDVYEYLSGHPAGVVHKGNLFDGFRC